MKFLSLVLTLLLLGAVVVAIFGFRGDHFTKPPFEVFPDMIYQDKVKDQVPSSFFADGLASRPPIDGTVAMEMPEQHDYESTGKWDDTHWGDGIPVHQARNGGRALAIDAANMARGRERYTISCAACHGATGDGKGITSKYGMTGAADYHTDRIIQMTDGEIFNTMTNGKGQMIGLGYNIAIDDRWRIIMYIRALERSQNATLEDATPKEQKQLQDTAKKPAGSASNASLNQKFIAYDGLHGPLRIVATYTSGGIQKFIAYDGVHGVPPRAISDFGPGSEVDVRWHQPFAMDVKAADQGKMKDSSK